MKHLLAIALVAVAACNNGESRQHIQLAHLGFDVPGDWHSNETNQEGLVTSVWTPDDNSRKESVTVIRSERSSEVAKAGLATLESLLASAQTPGAKASPATEVRTPQGLSGVRIDVDYVPPGLKASYHRVHVVLVDGSSLVHVFYTALSPDSNLEAFNAVLSSIREES